MCRTNNSLLNLISRKLYRFHISVKSHFTSAAFLKPSDFYYVNQFSSFLKKSVFFLPFLCFSISVQAATVDDVSGNTSIALAQDINDSFSLEYNPEIGDQEVHYAVPSRNTSKILPHVTVHRQSNSLQSEYDYYKFNANSGDVIIIDVDNYFQTTSSGWGSLGSSLFGLLGNIFFYSSDSRFVRQLNSAHLSLYFDTNNDGNVVEIDIDNLFNSRNGAQGSRKYDKHPMLKYKVPQGASGVYYVRVAKLLEFTAVSNSEDSINRKYETVQRISQIPKNTQYKLHVSVGSHNSLREFTDTDADGIHDDWESIYASIDYLPERKTAWSRLDLQPEADPDNDGRNNLQEYLDNTDPNIADIKQVKNVHSFENPQVLSIDDFSLNYSDLIGAKAINEISNNTSEEIPHITVNGKGSHLQANYYQFTAEQGEKVVIDIDRGVNSKNLLFNKPRNFLTSIQVLDSSDENIVIAQSSLLGQRDDYNKRNGGGGSVTNQDAFLELEVPETGDYIIKITRGVRPVFFYWWQRFRFLRSPVLTRYPALRLDDAFLLHVSIPSAKKEEPIDPDLDSDNDGIPDYWENRYGLDPFDSQDASADLDNDGVSNLDEFIHGISPISQDSDNDGILDGVEINWSGTNPSDGSSDDVVATDIFSDDYDIALIRKVMHVLNRLTYGANLNSFNALYPDGSISFENKYQQWLNAQLDNTVGIPGECDRRRMSFGDDLASTFSCRDSEATNQPRGYTNVNGVTGVVDLSGLSYKDTQGNTQFCNNNWFVLPNQSFNGAKGYEYYKTMTCLSLWQQQCENHGHDPAQCRRDIHRTIKSAQTFDDAYITGVMDSIRPLHSNQQLRSVVGEFWDNHFHTDFSVLLRNGGSGIAVGGSNIAHRYYDVDTYFMNAFGNFYQDLLLQSATSPAMLRFLDNIDNKVNQVNENYAREVMELHTLGAQSAYFGDRLSPVKGYNQGDVFELARIMTGWQLKKTPDRAFAKGYPGRYRYYKWDTNRGSLNASDFSDSRPSPAKDYLDNWIVFNDSPSSHGNIATFFFNEDEHDNQGNKVFLDFEIGEPGSNFEYAPQVFGQLLPTQKVSVELSGRAQGEFALRALAYHPLTAINMCRKLYTKFIGDEGMSAYISYNVSVNTQSSVIFNPYLNATFNSANVTLQHCAQTFWNFRSDKTQIKQVLKVLLSSSSAFFHEETMRNKSKDHRELGYSLHRVFNKEASSLFYPKLRRAGFINSMVASSHAAYTHPDPDGLSELSSEIESFDQMRRRMEVVRRFRGTPSHLIIWQRCNASSGCPALGYVGEDVTGSNAMKNAAYYGNPARHVEGHEEKTGYPAEYISSYFLSEEFIKWAYGDDVNATCHDYRDCIANKGLYPNLDKKITLFYLIMFYAGDYTGYDLQLIYEVLNPRKYRLDDISISLNRPAHETYFIKTTYWRGLSQSFIDEIIGRNLFHSGHAFTMREHAGGLSDNYNQERRARIHQLTRVLATTADFNVQ